MPNLPDHKSKPEHCLFSIDVEDWFHILDIPSAPPVKEWDKLPSRVENNFLKLLEILDGGQVRATCFFLGWVAEKYPHLVKKAAASGHEIASHGYGHQLVYKMTPQEFLNDAAKAKKILEDITGMPVLGYRSSGFSMTDKTPWVFDILTEAGYRYDSSIFPAAREHGGYKSDLMAPYRVTENSDSLIEIPISVARFLGRPICFFGGGYLRFFHYRLIKKMADRVIAEGRPVNFYIHPREVDPDHPRLPMSRLRRFKSYVNLAKTESKINKLLNDFDWIRFCDYIKLNFQSGEND